jgi:hypothetical protein
MSDALPMASIRSANFRRAAGQPEFDRRLSPRVRRPRGRGQRAGALLDRLDARALVAR